MTALKIISQQAQDVIIKIQISLSNSKIGKIDESIKTIKKLLSFKSSSEIPYIFLAELFFSQKKYSKALEYLSKA